MVIGRVLWEMFSWPNGIVVGNLIASAIVGIPAIVHYERKIQRQLREHLEKVEGEFRGRF